jgi:hypothetical protein
MSSIGVINIDPDPRYYGSKDPSWKLNRLRESFGECHELLKNLLWALVNEDDSGWLDIAIVEWDMTINGKAVVKHLLSVSGRKTYLPDGAAEEFHWGRAADGYIHFMDFTITRLALEFLESYFDGD